MAKISFSQLKQKMLPTSTLSVQDPICMLVLINFINQLFGCKRTTERQQILLCLQTKTFTAAFLPIFRSLLKKLLNKKILSGLSSHDNQSRSHYCNTCPKSKYKSFHHPLCVQFSVLTLLTLRRTKTKAKDIPLLFLNVEPSQDIAPFTQQAARFDTTRHDTTRHDAMRYDAMRHDTLKISPGFLHYRQISFSFD